MSALRFTHAIVCRVPKSYAESAINLKDTVDIDKVRKQHEEYVQTLREVGLDVIELPPDEKHPDCVFVEDIAVVCNGTALVTKPGHPSREKEVEYMRSILKNELELPVIEIKDPKATLDGGDVLFTGKEFFVGLSGRTNQAGACALASTFPEFPCVPIKVDKSLHLKMLITMAGPDVMCVGPSAEARDTLKAKEGNNLRLWVLSTLVENTIVSIVLALNMRIDHSYSDFYNTILEIFQNHTLSERNLGLISLSNFTKKVGYLKSCHLSLITRSTFCYEKHLKHIM
ncbi:unnamed protein product, partial [Meganyctiphanes norvegica]